MQDVNYTFDNSKLAHIFLFNLKVALLPVELIVVFEVVRFIHDELAFIAVDVLVFVCLKPIYHLVHDAFDLKLALLRLTEVAVSDL